MVLVQQTPLLSLVPVGIAWQLEPEIASILPVAVEDVSDPARPIWPEGLALSPAARRFREFILERARDMPASKAIRGKDGLMIEVGSNERRFRFIQPA